MTSWPKLIPKGLGKRGRQVAMDVVALPYHGTVEEVHHDEVCRSKAKGGTPHFFTYATAYAVLRGAPLYPGDVPRSGLTENGITWYAPSLPVWSRWVFGLSPGFLDRGFYSVRVIRDLITAELPFIMPAVKRGKKPTTAGGPTGTYALAAMKQGQWTSYPLKSPPEGHVDL